MIEFNLILNRSAYFLKQKQICYLFIVTAFILAIILLIIIYSYYFYLRQTLQLTIEQLQQKAMRVIAKSDESQNTEAQFMLKMTNNLHWQVDMINTLAATNLCLTRLEPNQSGYVLRGFAKSADDLLIYLRQSQLHQYFSQLLLRSAKPAAHSPTIEFVIQAINFK